MTEQVKVTQADRGLFCAIAGFDEGSSDYERVMSGSAWTCEVEQIARHCIAAQAELMEALGLAAYLSEVPHEPAMKIAKAIAKARGEA